MNKEFWKSKIFWTSIGTLAGLWFPPVRAVVDVIMEPATFATLATVAVAIFRLFATNTNLVVKK